MDGGGRTGGSALGPVVWRRAFNSSMALDTPSPTQSGPIESRSRARWAIAGKLRSGAQRRGEFGRQRRSLPPTSIPRTSLSQRAVTSAGSQGAEGCRGSYTLPCSGRKQLIRIQDAGPPLSLASNPIATPASSIACTTKPRRADERDGLWLTPSVHDADSDKM
jgi:hypothetical protein